MFRQYKGEPIMENIETTPPPIPQPQKNSLAVWSLVLGILSPLCCGFFTGIPAIICGHIAYSRSGRLLNRAGRGLALAGLILGYISFVMIPIQAALVLPAVSKARSRAVETVCMANELQIQTAKKMYSQKHNGETPASLDDLVSDGELPMKLMCPGHGEYHIGSKDENPTCSVHGDLIQKRSPATPSGSQVEK